ncbi:DUF6602 domain-containing protein [Pseudomonas chlororaphis]|uniref:DUF6602 domain-containing protein n=1 Tax=Pseudomonas chlororaphis TaxID=587753 RepID=UPI000F71E2F2|nr:DUF6602 domain-containing protein [Pseudomonas chlororaphis]AZE22665.1 hypothetical protein C4K08_2238 [Pseudomonas chlororaphis subsp. aureofaciens]
MRDRFWLEETACDGLLSANSVEKIGPSRLPAYWPLKTPFLRAAMRSPSPDPLLKVKILISSAYFSAVEIMATFSTESGREWTFGAGRITLRYLGLSSKDCSAIFMKNFKHYHGSPNPIMAQEEAAILLCVERALVSSTNSQTIGRNGELPFISFLQRYLPATLRAISGHFITPHGDLSPQIDVIVIDARYPLLSENSDGSALVMLHSVVQCYELKTNLTTRDVKKSIENSQKIAALAQQIKEFSPGEWSAPQITLVAYHTAQRLSSLETVFFSTQNRNSLQWTA